MKTRQILKVSDRGFMFTVIETQGAEKPYAVYRNYPTMECGYPKWHKELQVRYECLKDCLWFLTANCNL